jgi:hypothetical protein
MAQVLPCPSAPRIPSAEGGTTAAPDVKPSLRITTVKWQFGGSHRSQAEDWRL